MSTTSTPTTQLTIEQILDARLRAAQAYFDRCQAAIMAAAVDVAWIKVLAGPDPSSDGKLWISSTYEDVRTEARVATAELDAARRDISALRGEGAPMPYEPSSPPELKRLAAILWADNDELEAESAVELARLSDSVRFWHYRKTYMLDDDQDLKPAQA